MWYEEVFADDDKCFVVCESYRLHKKNSKCYSGALRSYPILEVKQCLNKESGTDYQGEGELMNKRRWIQLSTDSFVRNMMCIEFVF